MLTPSDPHSPELCAHTGHSSLQYYTVRDPIVPQVGTSGKRGAHPANLHSPPISPSLIRGLVFSADGTLPEDPQRDNNKRGLIVQYLQKKVLLSKQMIKKVLLRKRIPSRDKCLKVFYY